MKKLIITIILIILPNFVHATISVPTDFLTINSGLVGWWTMDGKHTNWNTNTTGDLSGNGNTGTMTNMSTSTSPVVGKVGQGLSFDGTDDNLSLGTLGSTGSQLGNGFTVSAWVYPRSTSISGLFSARTASVATLRIQLNSDQNLGNTARKIAVRLLDDGGLDLQGASTNAVLQTNVWNHLTLALTPSSNTIAMYINGVSVPVTYNASGQDTPSSFSNFTASTFGAVYNLGLGSYLNGSIDDGRFYNRVLSATEIAQLYTATAGSKGAVSLVGPGSLDSGLVGWWTFDGKDTNWNTNTTGDLSGNGNTGMMRNMSTSTSPVPGKIGQGIKFDGSDDSINLGSGSSLDDIQSQGGGGMTVAFWINPDSNTTKVIMEKGPGANGTGFWHFTKTSNTNPARLTFAKEGASDSSKNYNSLLNTGVWQHIVMTWDGSMTFSTGVQMYKNGVLIVNVAATDGSGANSDASQSICLGNVYILASDSCSASNNLDASLDDVRMYNRILSAAEIAQLYTATAGSKGAVSLVGPGSLDSGLVGWWTFDGKYTPWTSATAATAIDSSGNGYTGTLTSMSQATSPVPGRMGQALFFDGVNDYIRVNTAPTVVAPYTTSFWFYPMKLGSSQGLLYYGLSAAGKGIAFTSTNRIEIDSYSAGTFRAFCNKTFTAADLNKWFHVTIIVNSTTDASLWKCYLNGSDIGIVDSNSSGTYAAPGNTDWTIGAYYNNGYHFNGYMDDVRAYTRDLSAPEITQLYNAGRR